MRLLANWTLMRRKSSCTDQRGMADHKERWSALHHRCQGIPELRKRDGGGLCAYYRGLAISSERGDSKCHGDAMITEAVYLGGVEFLTAGNSKPVGVLRHVDAHAPQIVADGADTIGLLDAKLG